MSADDETKCPSCGRVATVGNHRCAPVGDDALAALADCDDDEPTGQWTPPWVRQ